MFEDGLKIQDTLIIQENGQKAKTPRVQSWGFCIRDWFIYYYNNQRSILIPLF